MSQNLVSLVLSNEQLAQAEQAVTTLEQALAVNRGQSALLSRCALPERGMAVRC